MVNNLFSSSHSQIHLAQLVSLLLVSDFSTLFVCVSNWVFKVRKVKHRNASERGSSRATWPAHNNFSTFPRALWHRSLISGTNIYRQEIVSSKHVGTYIYRARNVRKTSYTRWSRWNIDKQQTPPSHEKITQINDFLIFSTHSSAVHITWPLLHAHYPVRIQCYVCLLPLKMHVCSRWEQNRKKSFWVYTEKKN